MNNNPVKIRILEKAKEVLENEGLKGLTVQNLIEKCSIGKTTFYKQFPTKKDLLLQLKYYSNNDKIRIVNIKDQIAEIAKEGFARYGFSNMDMDTIARAARLNRVTLYRYFSNKDELLEYCIQSEFAKIIKYQSSFLEYLDAPETALRKCFELILSFQKIANGNSLISETWNQIFRNAKIKEYARELGNSFENMFMQILEAGKQKGLFRKDIDPSIFIRVMLIIQNGFLFTITFEPHIHSIDSVIDNMVNMVLREFRQP